MQFLGISTLGIALPWPFCASRSHSYPLQDISLHCRSFTAHSFHCRAFALLFLARPLHCCSQQRLRRATQAMPLHPPAYLCFAFAVPLRSTPSQCDSAPCYALAMQVSSMPFRFISDLCSFIAALGCALPLLRRSGLCRASHLHCRAMLHYSVTIHCAANYSARFHSIPQLILAMRFHCSDFLPGKTALA